jgi:hypothetical protein
VVLSWAYRARKAGSFRRECFGALLLLAYAIVPCALWMLRNRLVLGDWTGAETKVSHLGWQVKPLGQWLDHPLFSLAGQQAFWNRLFTSFYTGDLTWHGSPAMDFFPSEVFFLLAFAVLPVGLGGIWIRHRRHPDASSDLAGLLSALVIAGSVLVLIALSLVFDFGACYYPSREYPYLNSGRLLSGALVPVLALYVYGLAAVTNRAKWATAIILGVSVVLMVLPQLVLFGQVLRSQYNWFHFLVR